MRGLLREVTRFGDEHFGARAHDEPRAEHPRTSRDAPAFFHAWRLCHRPVEGRPIAAWFEAVRGPTLTSRERAWLSSQLGADLSIWKVVRHSESGGMQLRDLLAGTNGHRRLPVPRCNDRFARPAQPGLSIPTGACFLGRIVEGQGSILDGHHPVWLPTERASPVVRAAQAFPGLLLDQWEAAALPPHAPEVLQRYPMGDETKELPPAMGGGRTEGLGIGERAPDFVLPVAEPTAPFGRDGTPVRFYGVAGGRPLAMFFSGEGPAGTALFSRFIATLTGGLPAIAVLRGGPTAKTKQARDAPSGPGAPGTTCFVDPDGAVHRAYRLGEGSGRAFVLERNLRVAGSFPIGDPEATGRSALALRATLSSIANPVEVAGQAPVLLVPDALDRETCARLIDVFERHGSVETGVERSLGGTREDALDDDYKRRRDHTVVDPELLRSLTLTVGRRVMPEVEKAFSFRATRFEGFKIACYDALAGGHFRAHRDNLSPSTAHRRFALTLNLNEGYRGGHLQFPEYGPFLYRPATGEALVFSGSHLHEVRTVTEGRRYVLLSFLFAQRGEEQCGRTR